MVEELFTADVLYLLSKMCLDMEATQEELQELDAKAGDGDLGVTVKLGFAAVRENLSICVDKDIGTILIQSGMVFNKAAASTFGTLMATAFMKAGHVVKGQTRINLENLVAMLASAVNGIMSMGGALPGDRTMLDALIPARDAVEWCAAKSLSIKDAMAEAAKAAKKGAESTVGMIAKHGRAGWLSQKALGVPDAGATAIALMLGFISQHLDRKLKHD